MGNASSLQSKRDSPTKAQPASTTSTTSTPPSNAQSSLTRNTSRLGRSLKGKKRSIVDHPQLLVPPAGPTTPSAPIPIPAPNRGGAYPPRGTPPLNVDSTDDVPDLLSNLPMQATLRPAQVQLQQQPLPYNSTRSFGRVRRGGLMGVVDGMFVQLPPPPPPPPFKPELVYSTIPLRIGPSHPRVEQPKKKEKGKQPVREPVIEDGSVPTHIIWRDGGRNVFIAGTFHELEWRARERMRYDPITGVHTIVLNMQPGAYRIKFIVDDIWHCSDQMPTAVDDETGNLVNYIDVEDPSAIDLSSPPSGAEERQIIDARVMKANRRRTYPSRLLFDDPESQFIRPPSPPPPPPQRQPKPRPQTQPKPKTRHTRSPTTSRYHPPLLPPSESVFWGDLHDESETELEGWERGRDGVLEKWTNVVPEGLIAAAQQEEAFNAQKQKRRERSGEAEREREGRRGEREKRHGRSERYKAMGWASGWAGGPNSGAPNLPPPPRLPRHLDKVILNVKSSHQSTAASGSGSSTSGSHSGKSKSGKHKSRSRNTAALGMTSIFLPGPEARVAGATTLVPGLGPEPPRTNAVKDKEQLAMERASAALMEHWALHAQADDSSVLPVPSHVVLHHLGTSAIKNGVLAVSDTTRYNKKYITTIYYKPT